MGTTGRLLLSWRARWLERHGEVLAVASMDRRDAAKRPVILAASSMTMAMNDLEISPAAVK